MAKGKEKAVEREEPAERTPATKTSDSRRAGESSGTAKKVSAVGLPAPQATAAKNTAKGTTTASNARPPAQSTQHKGGEHEPESEASLAPPTKSAAAAGTARASASARDGSPRRHSSSSEASDAAPLTAKDYTAIKAPNKRGTPTSSSDDSSSSSDAPSSKEVRPPTQKSRQGKVVASKASPLLPVAEPRPLAEPIPPTRPEPAAADNAKPRPKPKRKGATSTTSKKNESEAAAEKPSDAVVPAHVGGSTATSSRNVESVAAEKQSQALTSAHANGTSVFACNAVQRAGSSGDLEVSLRYSSAGYGSSPINRRTERGPRRSYVS